MIAPHLLYHMMTITQVRHWTFQICRFAHHHWGLVSFLPSLAWRLSRTTLEIPPCQEGWPLYWLANGILTLYNTPCHVITYHDHTLTFCCHSYWECGIHHDDDDGKIRVDVWNIITLVFYYYIHILALVNFAPYHTITNTLIYHHHQPTIQYNM